MSRLEQACAYLSSKGARLTIEIGPEMTADCWGSDAGERIDDAIIEIAEKAGLPRGRLMVCGDERCMGYGREPNIRQSPCPGCKDA